MDKDYNSYFSLSYALEMVFGKNVRHGSHLGKVFIFATGSPTSKYEHRRASALLRNIQNIRICMGKKPSVSVTYENERISIKNSSPY